MKITEKHKIAYKSRSAPVEPAEMELYRDKDGVILTATGDWVAYADGKPTEWWQTLIDGYNDQYEGHIIEPEFEPYVGMVLEDALNPKIYYVCFRETTLEHESAWVSQSGVKYSNGYVLEVVKRGAVNVREENNG